LQRAAIAEGIELISLDNRYNSKIARRNANLLVGEKVDLVIEFQTDQDVTPIVAATYREAGIPLIAMDIPHPGATYYGANNYEAGLIAGRYLVISAGG
jgi:ribose transport system substrate-binding protein